MRVVIAEDLALLREGIASLLKDEGHEVLATVGDSDALLAAAAEHRPDLAIIDVRMPPTQTDEGVRASVELRRRQPDVAILILSQYVEERYATDLLGGAQKQQASSKLDQLGQQADRLSKEENAEAERVRKLAAAGEQLQKRQQGGAGGAPTEAELQAAEKERESLADARQQMSDGLGQLEKGQ